MRGGGILTVTFSNPENGGSFGLEEARRLAKTIKSNNPRGLLLTGKIGSRLFCSGGNLKQYAKLANKADGIRVNREIRKILSEIAALEIPKACAVTGDCFGGGIELVSCFDYVVTAPSSLFGFWQRRMGLTFGWGGAQRLLLRMSPRELTHLSASARTFGALEAKRIGLVDEVVFAPVLEARAREWLEQTLNSGAPVLRNHQEEVQLFEKLWQNQEHKKALKKYSGRK